MKTLAALLYLAIKLPLQFILRNKALIIIGIIAFIGFSVFNAMNGDKQSDNTQEYSQKLPDVKLAPDVWLTPSRHYYTVKYTEDESYAYLEDYFVFSDGEWTRVKPEIPLPLNKQMAKKHTRSMQ